MKQSFTFFNQHHIDDAIKSDLLERASFERLQAGKYLYPPELSHSLYLVRSGIIRALSHSYRPKTSYLFGRNDYFLPNLAMFSPLDEHCSLQACSDTTVLTISETDIQLLISKWPSLHDTLYKLRYTHVVNQKDHQYKCHATSSWQRFSAFAGQNEDFLNKIPLRYFADFLDVSMYDAYCFLDTYISKETCLLRGTVPIPDRHYN
ncbi:Crp/Fnr family transcriptional regulator [Dyadobacter sp. BHUBP1]|uniref:Crp/Fnr family transcriptional regulator n=1 Tax=Dyadobacter sp. BHUBP1 TaxID=3424178 RepID=UPI003D335277